jgi:hypothetical protein
MLGGSLAKLLCASLGKLNVAKENERSYIEIFSDGAKLQIALKARNLHSVIHICFLSK